MVSRRRFLHLTGSAAVTSLAGCLDSTRTGTPGDDATTTDTTSQDDTTPTTEPTPLADPPVRTPGDVPAWSPTWTMTFDGWRVRGLNRGDGVLYATLTAQGRDGSAVAAVDPAAQSVLWRREMAGRAVGVPADHRPIGREGVGVTRTPDALYAVSGNLRRNEWSAVHALDPATGDHRWSLRRQRELAVAGVLDSLVVVTGLEFFPGVGEVAPTHTTPEEPLTTVVYGVDAADGNVRWTREFAGVRAVDVGAGGVHVAASGRLVGLDRQGQTRFERGTGPVGRLECLTDTMFLLEGPGLRPTSDQSATLHRLTSGGEREWTRDLPVNELLVDPGAERLYLGGDSVYAVGFDGQVAWYADDYGEWLLLDPDRDTLYTRSGLQADAATAYDVAGDARWRFDPSVRNAWPEAATSDSLVVSAITPDDGNDQFLTVYAVDGDGRATAALDIDTVSAALGRDGTVYLADGDAALHALSP